MKVGVVLSPESTAEGVRRYAELRALALQAESAGFDSVWVFDHLFMRFPPKPDEGSWEAWTLLTAFAEATERVELGTLVLGSPFRNPVHLAKMAATLDEISSGRLILGLGAGWHEPEFKAMGISFAALADRFEEALQIIVPLLHEGQVTFQGRYYQAADAVILPRGPRAGGPPILIGAFGPRLLRLTARYADLWNTAWYGHADDKLKAAQVAMRVACEEVRRDPATLTMTAGVSVAGPGSDGASAGNSLSGSAEEMAAGLRGFEEAGMAHAICEMSPTTGESLDRLAEGLRVYRRMATS